MEAIAGGAVVVFMFAIILVALWLLIAGDREQDIVDEPPTLNTRNDRDAR